MTAQKQKFYAVVKGKRPGLYTEWFGPEGAEAQIRGVAGARYKGFGTREEALGWLATHGMSVDPGRRCRSVRPEGPREDVLPDRSPPGKIIVYTDGSSTGNPGPGGWGVVRLTPDGREEFSGGYRLTTNNRMELAACIEGLKDLPPARPVTLFSDSQYVVNGINLGWAENWRARGWMRNRSDKAENADLWGRLLDLLHTLNVEFVWVRGHAGNPGNARCDTLATGAASKPNLPEDTGYLRAKQGGQEELL
ncbi:MAG TPA: ribonuclease HI [bacterium]|nr:ribonuclease HI [bacterium]